MPAITPYKTQPCQTLKAIGQELGLKTEETLINGIIIKSLEEFLHESQSNCVWMIQPSLPMITTLNDNILKTLVLLTHDNNLQTDLINNIKTATDLAFLYLKTNYNPKRISQNTTITHTYDLQDPQSLTQLEQNIQSLKSRHKLQERTKWETLHNLAHSNNTTKTNSNATSSPNFSQP